MTLLARHCILLVMAIYFHDKVVCNLWVNFALILFHGPKWMCWAKLVGTEQKGDNQEVHWDFQISLGFKYVHALPLGTSLLENRIRQHLSN